MSSIGPDPKEEWGRGEEFKDLSHSSSEILDTFKKTVFELKQMLETSKDYSDPQEYWRPAVKLLWDLANSMPTLKEVIEGLEVAKKISCGKKYDPLRLLAKQLKTLLFNPKAEAIPNLVEAFCLLLDQRTELSNIIYDRVIILCKDKPELCLRVIQAFDNCIRLEHGKFELKESLISLIKYCYGKVSEQIDGLLNSEKSKLFLNATTILKAGILEEESSELLGVLFKKIDLNQEIEDLAVFLSGLSQHDIRYLADKFNINKNDITNLLRGIEYKIKNSDKKLSAVICAKILIGFRRFDEQKVFYPDLTSLNKLETYLCQDNEISLAHIQALYAYSVFGLGGKELSDYFAKQDWWKKLKKLVNLAELANAFYHFGHFNEAQAVCKIANNLGDDKFKTYGKVPALMIGRVASALGFKFSDDIEKYLDDILNDERNRLLENESRFEKLISQLLTKLGFGFERKVIKGRFLFGFEVRIGNRIIYLEAIDPKHHFIKGDLALGRIAIDTMKRNYARREGLTVKEVFTNKILKIAFEKQPRFLKSKLEET